MREIRIHGVAGTPPQDMLGVPAAADVERVTSYVDPRTGFYRTRPGVEVGWWSGPDGVSQPPPGVVSEAYSWGALTSSGGSFIEALRRAGWLSLLPLALVNVAYWARPGIDKPSVGRTWTAVAIRWAGLLMTAALIASVCLVAIDLVAWQCFRGGGQVCSFAVSVPFFGTVDLSGALGFLGQAPWRHPARRVLVGSLLPIFVLLALWLLSRQSSRRYEAVPDLPSGWSRADAARDSLPGLDGDQPILRRERMWQGQLRVGRQQLLHVSVGLAVTVQYAALTLLSDPDDPEAPWWRVLGQVQQEQSWLSLVVVVAGLSLVAAFAGSALSVQDGNDFHGLAQDRPVLDGWARIASATAVALAVVAYAALVGLALGPLSAVPIFEGREALAEVPFVGFIFVLLAAIVAGLTFASRGGWWPWLAAAVPIGLAVITNAALPRTAAESPSTWPTVAAAALWIAAIVGLLYVFHRTSLTPEHAWGGAGPGVVLGAATLVALVFSASLVVGLGAVLNGADPVTQLQSDFNPERSAGQVAIALGPVANPAEALTADGPVTLRDGSVCVTPDAVTVTSGSLVAAGLSAMPAGPPFGGDGIARAVPDVLLSSGQLTLPAGQLLLQDSTLATAPTCAAESVPGTFVAAGEVPIGGPLLVAGEVLVRTQQVPQELLEVPSLLLWFAALVPIWLLGALLMALFTWLVLRRRGGPAVDDQLAVDDPADEAGWDDVRRRGPRLVAAYAHRSERLGGLLALLTAFVGLAGILGASTTEPPWRRIEQLHALGDIGLLVTIGLALAILWFASGVRRSASLRRQAGILWDVSTFWPRVAHPFGPPCYAERVVPETTRRVREALAEEPTRPVVLSGHSQGSTIVAAVAARLSDDQLRRLRLVTYGSQLRAWFGRIFPGVFGPDAMGTSPIQGPWLFRSSVPDAPAQILPADGDDGPWQPPLAEVADHSLRYRVQAGSAQTRWVNFFRRSDPLGFLVFSDRESPHDAPIGTWQDRYLGEVAANHDLQTHSNYQGSEDYRDLITHWARMAVAEDDEGRDG